MSAFGVYLYFILKKTTCRDPKVQPKIVRVLFTIPIQDYLHVAYDNEIIRRRGEDTLSLRYFTESMRLDFQ